MMDDLRWNLVLPAALNLWGVKDSAY